MIAMQMAAAAKPRPALALGHKAGSPPPHTSK
jgi:hypothetical protein